MNISPTDLIQKPLLVIQNITDHIPVDSIRNGDIPNIAEICANTLLLNNAMENSYKGSIPSLNNGYHQVRNGSLVKFRCMVQNHFDPEYYLPFFLEIDKATQKKSIKNARYHDNPLINENTCMEYEYEFPPMDRAVINCCAIPGETNWVKDMYNALDTVGLPLPHSEYIIINDAYSKRKRTDEEERIVHAQEERKTMDISSGKVSKLDDTAIDSISNVNKITNVVDIYPPSISAVVKFYDNQTTPKIGQNIEVYGILDIHHEDNDNNGVFDLKQVAPGSSSLHKYRIHAVHYNVLNNFHIPVVEKTEMDTQLLSEKFSSELKAKVATLVQDTSLCNARDTLLRGFTSVCGGDAVAGYAQLLHSLTSISWKPDCIGKFNISLCSLSRNTMLSAVDTAQDIICQLQEVLPKCIELAVTTDKLNNTLFVPVKEEDSSELQQGSLQVSNRSSIIINETNIEEGQIDAKGIENLRGLAYLSESSKLQYHFPYMAPVEFQVDTPLLILSAENTLCPSDLKIQLKPNTQATQATVPNTPSPAAMRLPSWAQQAEQSYVSWNLNSIPTDTLALVQMYIYISKLYTNMQDPQEQSVEIIHKAILQRLQTKRERASPEILHIIMAIAKLVASSYFKTDVDQQAWDEACTFVDHVLDRNN